jgi:hypothetical protein
VKFSPSDPVWINADRPDKGMVGEIAGTVIEETSIGRCPADGCQVYWVEIAGDPGHRWLSRACAMRPRRDPPDWEKLSQSNEGRDPTPSETVKERMEDCFDHLERQRKGVDA